MLLQEPGQEGPPAWRRLPHPPTALTHMPGVPVRTGLAYRVGALSSEMAPPVRIGTPAHSRVLSFELGGRALRTPAGSHRHSGHTRQCGPSSQAGGPTRRPTAWHRHSGTLVGAVLRVGRAGAPDARRFAPALRAHAQWSGPGSRRLDGPYAPYRNPRWHPLDSEIRGFLTGLAGLTGLHGGPAPQTTGLTPANRRACTRAVGCFPPANPVDPVSPVRNPYLGIPHGTQICLTNEPWLTNNLAKANSPAGKPWPARRHRTT